MLNEISEAADSGRKGDLDDGFDESRDVGVCFGRLDGVWDTGGVRSPSRGFLADAPAAKAGGSEGSAARGACLVKIQ